MRCGGAITFEFQFLALIRLRTPMIRVTGSTARGVSRPNSTRRLRCRIGSPRTRAWLVAALFALMAGAAVAAGTTTPAGPGWRRHAIDDSSRGPDGVRLGDINGDGLPDFTSPWEQGNRVVVYFHPGHAKAREPWPHVVVGAVGDPEDAVFVDLDGDGVLDVVSACEGETRAVFVHWAPADRKRLRDPAAWQTALLGDSAGQARWMFTLPLQIDGEAGVDLVVGSRGQNAAIGWWESPASPRRAADWRWHRLYSAGWVMTLRAHDMDGDGDMDIVATDRTGRRRGALWLEHPGSDADLRRPWREYRIGPVDEHEAMHHTIADLDRDGRDDVIVAVKGGPLRFHRRIGDAPVKWETHLIEMPANTGSGKAVEVADVDRDGRLDLVVTCEHATDGKIGVFWLAYASQPTDGRWRAQSINGGEGFIFDLLQLVDLDGDGDLDVLTEEEKGPYLAAGYVGRELGVVWYENPAR